MTDEKTSTQTLAEISARDQMSADTWFKTPNTGPARAFQDRRWLLQEVDRLQAALRDLADPVGTQRVLTDILQKRQRQVVIHGRTRLHDDQHQGGELASAAMPYVQAAYASRWSLTPEELLVYWPWDDKPNLAQPTRELLINAAALIVAEIERLDRLTVAALHSVGESKL